MTGEKMQRPAEKLASSIDKQIKAGADVLPPTAPGEYRLVSIWLLKRWRSLAKSVDARMRLDGSKLNKKKTKRGTE